MYSVSHNFLMFWCVQCGIPSWSLWLCRRVRHSSGSDSFIRDSRTVSWTLRSRPGLSSTTQHFVSSVPSFDSLHTWPWHTLHSWSHWTSCLFLSWRSRSGFAHSQGLLYFLRESVDSSLQFCRLPGLVRLPAACDWSLGLPIAGPPNRFVKQRCSIWFLAE